MQRAVAAAADVGRAAPVQELVVRARPRGHSRRRAGQRGPDAASASGRSAEWICPSSIFRPRRSRSPRTVQRAPRASTRSSRGREAHLLDAARALAADDALVVRVIAHAHHVDALEREPRPLGAAGSPSAAPRGRARRPSPARRVGTSRSRRPAARAARRARPSRRTRRRTRSRPRPWTASGPSTTMTACSSRNASGPPAGVHDPLDLAVGRRDRGDLRERAVLVRVRVVVGQREQQEVEEVGSTRYARRSRVLVAHAREAELRPAGRLARREQVGVEELARAHRGRRNAVAASRESAVSTEGSCV